MLSSLLNYNLWWEAKNFNSLISLRLEDEYRWYSIYASSKHGTVSHNPFSIPHVVCNIMANRPKQILSPVCIEEIELPTTRLNIRYFICICPNLKCNKDNTDIDSCIRLKGRQICFRNHEEIVIALGSQSNKVEWISFV